MRQLLRLTRTDISEIGLALRPGEKIAVPYGHPYRGSFRPIGNDLIVLYRPEHNLPEDPRVDLKEMEYLASSVLLRPWLDRWERMGPKVHTRGIWRIEPRWYEAYYRGDWHAWVRRRFDRCKE